MTTAEKQRARRLRCAVYTRKSSEDGLEQSFNSLDAQREACEAYIVSQRSEGWALVPDYYDDGGVSGGTLKRPALERLLADIEAGLIDIVVVYKIDRLTRSLVDFGRLIEAFEARKVTFVSITQSFNTTSSMGRLMLNVLLSFAQFEREVTGERIRDKIAASRRKGMWMGGTTPFGYRVENRRLVIEEKEAGIVQRLFKEFVELGSATTLAKRLRDEGVATKSGKLFDKGTVYRILNNQVYRGRAVHKGQVFAGEHRAIISEELWEQTREILTISPRTRAGDTRSKTPALLKGIIFGADGSRMTPTHTRKSGKLYRYYVSQCELKNGASDCPWRRVSADQIESAVVARIRFMFLEPEFVAGTWMAAKEMNSALSEDDVRKKLAQFDGVWSNLFPDQKTRLIQLVVNRVTVHDDRLEISCRNDLPGPIWDIGRDEAQVPEWV